MFSQNKFFILRKYFLGGEVDVNGVEEKFLHPPGTGFRRVNNPLFSVREQKTLQWPLGNLSSSSFFVLAAKLFSPLFNNSFLTFRTLSSRGNESVFLYKMKKPMMAALLFVRNFSTHILVDFSRKLGNLKIRRHCQSSELKSFWELGLMLSLCQKNYQKNELIK